jgi:RNase_H superfamily
MRPREGDIGSGGSSIVEYERWLHTQDPQILVDIEDYNRDDVESTWRLRGWLEGQRAQLIESGEDVPRRSNPQPSDIELVDPELAGLIHRLTADREQVLMAEAEHSADPDVPAPEPSDDQRARWLTADLLQWHRREAKPEWWQYFDRVLRYEDDDFVSDPETIGGLVLEGEVGKVKRSTIWRYRFDPGQDFKLSVGHKVVDPARVRSERLRGRSDTGNAGTICAIDGRDGTIELSRGNQPEIVHPVAIMPGGPLRSPLQQASPQRVA